MGIDNVEDLGARVQYVASAAQTDFDYPFAIFTDADLVVDIDGTTKALSTDYTVSGAGADTGGTVTLLSALTGGEIVTIYRDIAIERLTDIQQNGPWSSTAYNDEQDKTYLLLQQLDSRCDRSLRIPFTAEVADADIELFPVDYADKYLAFDSDGKPTPAFLSDATLTSDIVNSFLTAAGVGAVLYPRTAAEISAGVTPTNYQYEPGNVLRYGTNTTPGTTDITSAVSSAFSVSATHTTILPQETMLITSELTVPAYGKVIGGGRNSCLKKGFNGDLLSLGKHSSVSSFRIDGNKASYTGRGIVVSEGGGGATTANQGQQFLFNIIIDECSGYPLEYTGASFGWQSVALRCQFSNYGSDAAVKWPDESGTGENRKLIGCYASDALLNVGGCDNGMIKACVAGSANGANGGIIWPSGTTYRAKKLIIVGNRFAIASGTMTIRGIDSVFTNNIVAGSIVLASNASSDGCSTLTYRDNTLTGTFTDSSATTNYVFIDVPIAFTPTWSSTGTAPDLGNADVRCEYTRRGMYIRAKYFIKFGTTTTFGTGTYKFSIPVNRYTSTTTMFVGVALLKDRAGVVETLFQSSDDSIRPFDGSGNAMTPTAPVTWASTDVLCMDIEYRIG